MSTQCIFRYNETKYIKFSNEKSKLFQFHLKTKDNVEVNLSTVPFECWAQVLQDTFEYIFDENLPDFDILMNKDGKISVIYNEEDEDKLDGVFRTLREFEETNCNLSVKNKILFIAFEEIY